ERVSVVPLRRVRSEPVPHRARPVEAVDRRADHLATARAHSVYELVREHRLARSVRSVDRHPRRMARLDGEDRPGEPTDQVAAAAQGPPWPTSATVAIRDALNAPGLAS